MAGVNDRQESGGFVQEAHAYEEQVLALEYRRVYSECSGSRELDYFLSRELAPFAEQVPDAEVDLYGEWSLDRRTREWDTVKVL